MYASLQQALWATSGFEVKNIFSEHHKMLNESLHVYSDNCVALLFSETFKKITVGPKSPTTQTQSCEIVFSYEVSTCSFTPPVGNLRQSFFRSKYKKKKTIRKIKTPVKYRKPPNNYNYNMLQNFLNS